MILLDTVVIDVSESDNFARLFSLVDAPERFART